MPTQLEKIIFRLKCSGRLDKAESSGRMQYRSYRLLRWADNTWHIYAPYGGCIDEATTLREAIQVIEHDIDNFCA